MGRVTLLRILIGQAQNGTEFKKILHLLPEILRVSECVPENARDSLSKLWVDFYALYSVMNTWSPSDEQIDGFFASAQKWVSDFFTRQGVEKCNDDIKMIYHRKSNNHNSTAESLRVRFRKSYLTKTKSKESKENKKGTINFGLTVVSREYSKGTNLSVLQVVQKVGKTPVFKFITMFDV
ncbi:unnamed protein product [Mytilus coruscus]|uniref:Uncharacterized protein n=1 Tax=Mytilus coruscus TaxID=42192 RepID=A0A6J8B7R7_MYTCO|nr:unnamed protein product [Mytilus coruscus]